LVVSRNKWQTLFDFIHAFIQSGWVYAVENGKWKVLLSIRVLEVNTGKWE
jgi:hypothetical protein